MKLLLLITALCCLPASADVYELRTYTPHEGKLEALLTRFSDHTLAIFESHGMKNIGYWLTAKKNGETQKLVYLISHKDAKAAVANWSAFSADPNWKKVSAASQLNGKLVKKVERQFLSPTDFSKLK